MACYVLLESGTIKPVAIFDSIESAIIGIKHYRPELTIDPSDIVKKRNHKLFKREVYYEYDVVWSKGKYSLVYYYLIQSSDKGLKNKKYVNDD